MKRLTLLLLVLSLIACGLLPGTPVGPVGPTATPPLPVDLTPAQLAALSALSLASGLPLDQLAIVSTEAVDWPDSCVGVIRAGMGCVGVITPGFRIILAAKGFRYEYHTNQAGSIVAPATLVLVWHSEGGLAGVCDDLYVYLSGEAYGSSCANGDLYPAGRLTAAELLRLETWIKTYRPIALQPAGLVLTDAPTASLTLSARGIARPTEAEQTDLFAWAQAIYDRLKPCC